MTAPFGDALRALVERVDGEWAAARREPTSLPTVASAALAGSSLCRELTIDNLCAYVARSPDLPRQLDPGSTFGEPPVTLATGDGFHVDAYLWVQPATMIHDHGFSGAFQVVEGVSLHTTYDFGSSDGLDAPIRQGTLAISHAEILHPGAVRPIAAGLACVHQVAHLAAPSLSLIVRTTSAQLVPRCYQYLHPGIALGTVHDLTVAQRRRLEIAGWVFRMQRPNAVADLGALVATDDALLTAWVLRVVARYCAAPDVARQLAKTSPHAFAVPFVEALADDSRGGGLAQLSMVDDAGGRLRWVALNNGLDGPTIQRLLTEFESG